MRSSPRRLRLLTGLVLLAACGPAAPGGSTPSGAPVGALVCAEPVVDLGEVWEGAVLEHEFELEMRAAEPGPIASVRADCGCTVVDVEVLEPGARERRTYAEGEPIAPGSRVFLGVRYDTRGKEGGGPRSVTVYGPTGAYTVELHARVRAWMRADPARVDLGVVPQAEGARTAFVVTSTEGSSFRLRHVRKAVPEELTVRLAPRQPAADGRASAWDVDVELAPGAPRGPRGYPIYLESDVSDPTSLPESDGSQPMRSCVAWISVNLVGPIALEPAHLVMGVVPEDETVARSVRLISYDPDFRLPEPRVRLEPPAAGDATSGEEPFALARTARLSVEPIPGANAWSIQLLLEGLDSEVPNNFRGQLVIETGHPEEGRLVAQVAGVRLPRGASAEGAPAVLLGADEDP